MSVGFFQYAVVWRNKNANLSNIESKIKNEKFDLLVLPVALVVVEKVEEIRGSIRTIRPYRTWLIRPFLEGFTFFASPFLVRVLLLRHAGF